MAVQWDVQEKFARGSIYKFYPQDIVIRPELNGRHDVPNIDELKKDILERGQMQPVGIRNDGGKPVLAFGFSRWRAVSELNQNEMQDNPIMLTCMYIKMNEQAAFIANYKENRIRSATTPLDDAHAFAQLQRWGKTPAQIAKDLGVSVAFVNQRIELVSATEEVQEALQEGRLKPSAARVIAKLSAKQQRDVVKGTGPITKGKVQEVTGKASKPTPKQSLASIKPLIQEAADGHKVEAVKEFARKLLWRIEAPE